MKGRKTIYKYHKNWAKRSHTDAKDPILMVMLALTYRAGWNACGRKRRKMQKRKEELKKLMAMGDM